MEVLIINTVGGGEPVDGVGVDGGKTVLPVSGDEAVGGVERHIVCAASAFVRNHFNHRTYVLLHVACGGRGVVDEFFYVAGWECGEVLVGGFAAVNHDEEAAAVDGGEFAVEALGELGHLRDGIDGVLAVALHLLREEQLVAVGEGAAYLGHDNDFTEEVFRLGKVDCAEVEVGAEGEWAHVVVIAYHRGGEDIVSGGYAFDCEVAIVAGGSAGDEGGVL